MNDFLLSLNILNKSTILTIKQSIIRLEKLLEIKVDDIDLNILKNINGIINLLTENYSLNSTITTLLHIRKLVKYKNGGEALILEYNSYIDELTQLKDKQREKQEFKDEKEAENYIEYLDLKKKIIDLSSDYLTNKKSFTEYRNYLIVCLYVLMPPCRISNWNLMKIKDVSNMKRKGESLTRSYNYLIRLAPNQYEVIFNNYKTKSTLGQVVYRIESNLLNKLIERWLNEYNWRPKNGYFMVNANGKTMEQSNFTHAIANFSNKLFGKELSNNSLRRSFLSYFLSLNPSFLEKQKVLSICGQSAIQSTAEGYVRRLNQGEYVLHFD